MWLDEAEFIVFFEKSQSKQFVFNLQVKTLQNFLHTSYVHAITFYSLLDSVIQHRRGEKCMSAEKNDQIVALGEVQSDELERW